MFFNRQIGKNTIFFSFNKYRSETFFSFFIDCYNTENVNGLSVSFVVFRCSFDFSITHNKYILAIWLQYIPMLFKKHWPFKKYFWQKEEIEQVNVATKILAEKLGCSISHREDKNNLWPSLYQIKVKEGTQSK